MRHVVLSALLFTFLACSSPPPGESYAFDPCSVVVLSVAPGASEAERASVAEGAALWNRTGATRFTLEDVAGAPRLTVRFQDAAAAFHGLYDGERRELYVNHAVTDARQRAITVAHELGHAVGLPHIDSRVSVMEPANLVVEPNRDDATDVLLLWGACSPP